MSNFKTGSKVICVEDSIANGLKKGDEYLVKSLSRPTGDYLYIENIGWCLSGRFKLKEDFDWKKSLWRIPVESPEHAKLVIEYLKTKGYEFENEVQDYYLFSAKYFCNYYSGVLYPHDYLLYSTKELNEEKFKLSDKKVYLITIDTKTVVDKVTITNQDDLQKELVEVEEKLKEITKRKEEIEKQLSK